MRFVNPKNDIAFKKIFGSENKRQILISFLNAVLDLQGDKAIQQLQILNPYQTPQLDLLKTSILDVKATDKRGITYIIEMQIEHVSGAKKRFTYYTAKAYASQIKRGEEYPKLNQVIFIGLLDFVLFEENSHYLSRHQLLDVATGRQEFSDLELTFIELPKFSRTAEQVKTLLEKWIFFIKHAEDLDVVPEHVTEAPLQEAYQVAEQFAWQPDDLEAYEYRSMKIQDERGALTLAEKRGVAKGAEQKALETARKMKAKGYPLAEIADLTDLDETTLAKL